MLVLRNNNAIFHSENGLKKPTTLKCLTVGRKRDDKEGRIEGLEKCFQGVKRERHENWYDRRSGKLGWVSNNTMEGLGIGWGLWKFYEDNFNNEYLQSVATLFIVSYGCVCEVIWRCTLFLRVRSWNASFFPI